MISLLEPEIALCDDYVRLAGADLVKVASPSFRRIPYDDHCPPCPACQSTDTGHARTTGNGNASCRDCGKIFTDPDYGKSDKVAGDAELAGYPFSGMLYATPKNWVLLSVPNALVRGAFDAMDEPGIELPPDSESLGRLNAHVSVMRPEEVEQIGGIDRITERGHRFNYQVKPVYQVKPDGWAEMERCWFFRVDSPDLEKLRKSYGLSPIPDNGNKPFHITLAVRRKGVLGPNEKSKGPEAPKLSPDGLAWERAA